MLPVKCCSGFPFELKVPPAWHFMKTFQVKLYTKQRNYFVCAREVSLSIKLGNYSNGDEPLADLVNKNLSWLSFTLFLVESISSRSILMFG